MDDARLNAHGHHEEEDEEDRKPEKDPLEVSRRLIYLHRLAGDYVTQPKRRFSRASPWRVTVVFVCYAFTATTSMFTFAHIEYANSINSALHHALENAAFRIKAQTTDKIKNITQAPDVLSYVKHGLLGQLLIGGLIGEDRTLLGYNKILSQPGFCRNASVLSFTLRQMSTVKKHKETTTDRFKVLYPETWSGGQITAGSKSTKAENKSTLWGNYLLNRANTQKIPTPFLGYKHNGGGVKWTDSDLTSSQYHEVWTKWDYTPECKRESCNFEEGYFGKGGYVAAIILQLSAAHKAKIASMAAAGNKINWDEINQILDDQYVYLLSPNGDNAVYPSNGTCAGGIRATNIIRFADFSNAAFVGRNTASLALQFFAYNPNTQAVADIVVKWNVYHQGLVIDEPHIHVSTINLDLESSYFVVWEVFYIIGTAMYFVQLFIFSLYKYKWELFRNIWSYVNAVSILCSIISIAFRIRCSSTNADFLDRTKSLNVEVDDLSTFIQTQQSQIHDYRVVSAIACLTIWLRVVELLAQTPPRVKLLEATLIKALGNMCIYFGYIVVIIIGFWCFAAVHFAALSHEFKDPFFAFISIFELLCLNVLPYTTTKGSTLRRFFFIPFMLFSIISVQMFNSIINYAYNRVSEEMEPQFKRRARERKNKEKTRRGYVETFMLIFRTFTGFVRRKIGTRLHVSEGTAAKEKKKSEGIDVIHREVMHPVEKEKLEAYEDSRKKAGADERFVTVVSYVVFAVCYLVFLSLAMDVRTSGMINDALSAAFEDTQVPVMHTTSDQYFLTLMDVDSWDKLSLWVTEGVPRILNNAKLDSSFSGQDLYSNDTICLSSWNCLVAGKEAIHPKVLRITQRYQRIVPNDGLHKMDPPSPLPTPRLQLSPKIVATRGSSVPLKAEKKPDTTIEDTTTDFLLTDDGTEFCKRVTNQKDGYAGNGGIVCMIDLDLGNLTRQLALMRKHNFYASNLGTVMVEMVAYNGNSDICTHIAIIFTMMPSGRVQVTPSIETFKLLPVKGSSANATTFQKVWNIVKNIFQVSMICGVVYISLTCFFVVNMGRDLKSEAKRKADAENMKCSMAVFEFFAKDVFHALDFISYGISFVSMVLYCIWMDQQLGLADVRDRGFAEFITYVDGLASTSRAYGVLSAFNLLVILVRPLKFVRSSPRMQNLNNTFWGAMPDIFWFIVMLVFFFAPFVFFAHLFFGTHIVDLANLADSTVYVFTFLIGQFQFMELFYVHPLGAVFFVFTVIFLFKFFFLNVFFAIIDRNFVATEVPPLNIKRNLKPVFGRLFRQIEWDDDYTMEAAKVDNEKGGTGTDDSRSGKVHQLMLEINALRDMDFSTDGQGGSLASKSLADVCDVGERMSEVLRWSREEAKAFVDKFIKLFSDKQEFRNDDVFLKNKVQPQLQLELKSEERTMGEAERHQRYAILINEAMERRDQETLARYIIRLEEKITRTAIEKHALQTDVYHLRAESEKMRYADDELKAIDEEPVENPTDKNGPEAAPKMLDKNGPEAPPKMLPPAPPAATAPRLQVAGDAGPELENKPLENKPTTPLPVDLPPIHEAPADDDDEYAEAPANIFNNGHASRPGNYKVFNTMR